MIPKEILEEIKSKLDIVDVVGSYLNLKKVGKNYSSLCPFHAEDTPSFFVFPQTQTFHCFGCGAHGDAITFIQKYEKISFMDAVKKAAKLAGVDISAYLKIREIPPELSFLKDLNKIYMNNLQSLPSNHLAWKYLKSRGITKDIARYFELGYSEGNEIYELIKELDVSEELAINSGVLNKDGRSLFKNRLIIPIKDSKGFIVAFAGRTLENEEPKYINTPETKYFKKSKILYLFDKARANIKKFGFVILVEGYFDAIRLHLSGFENAVALLGTALTKEHVNLLSQVTQKTILMLDMDKAGEEATIRSLMNLVPRGFQIAVAKYDEKDPDELVEKRGKEALKIVFKDSIKFHEYIIDYYSKKYDLSNEFAQQNFLKEMAFWYFLISKSNNIGILNNFLNRISEITKISIEKLEETLKRLKIAGWRQIESTQTIKEPEEKIEILKYEIDKLLLWLWIKFPEHREDIKEKFEPDDFDGPAKEFLSFIKSGKEISEILNDGSNELINMIESVWFMNLEVESDEVLADIIETVDRKRLERKIEKLKEKLTYVQDKKEKNKIIEEILDILRKLKSKGGIY